MPQSVFFMNDQLTFITLLQEERIIFLSVEARCVDGIVKPAEVLGVMGGACTFQVGATVLFTLGSRGRVAGTNVQTTMAAVVVTTRCF